MTTKQVLNLRPSQFVLGMQEVDAKVKKIRKMTPKQRKKYVAEHCVPVVKFEGKLYIIDHHHFVRACWECGIKKVNIHVFSLYGANTWDLIVRNNWAYMVDQFGNEHKDHNLLPTDVRGMADDPYRSLAWAVREAGGFKKVIIPFSEFEWADYFRKNINLPTVRYNFDVAVKQALVLCSSKKASKLPGFSPKK